VHNVTTMVYRVKHCSRKEYMAHRGKLHAFWKMTVTFRPLYFLGKRSLCSLDRRLGGSQIQSGRGGGNKIVAPCKNRTVIVKPYWDTRRVFHKRVRPPQTLSSDIRTHFIPSLPISPRSVLIFNSHLHLDLSSDIFLGNFLTKIICAFYIPFSSAIAD
jgi:hypothetical protein